MAKVNNSLTFKNATISVEDNTITEVLKDEEIVHVLSDVLNQFQVNSADITFKETKDVSFDEEV